MPPVAELLRPSGGSATAARRLAAMAAGNTPVAWSAAASTCLPVTYYRPELCRTNGGTTVGQPLVPGIMGSTVRCRWHMIVTQRTLRKVHQHPEQSLDLRMEQPCPA